jgi:hypothetical protein
MNIDSKGVQTLVEKIFEYSRQDSDEIMLLRQAVHDLEKELEQYQELSDFFQDFLVYGKDHAVQNYKNEQLATYNLESLKQCMDAVSVLIPQNMHEITTDDLKETLRKERAAYREQKQETKLKRLRELKKLREPKELPDQKELKKRKTTNK